MYDKKLKRVMHKKIDTMYYDDFYMTEDNIVVKSGDEISIYGFFGNMIFEKHLDDEVIYVEKISSFPLMEYYMATNNMFKRVVIY